VGGESGESESSSEEADESSDSSSAGSDSQDATSDSGEASSTADEATSADEAGDGDSAGDGDGDATSAESGGEPGSLDLSILIATDDAEENEAGEVVTVSTDLELVDDPMTWGSNQVVGIRFQVVNIPAAATITSARLDFTVDEPTSEATDLLVQAQSGADPLTFSEGNGDITSRPRTNASVSWYDVPPWPEIGFVQSSPDLSPLVQELVDAPGWTSGQSLVFLVTGTGARVATAYDGNPTASTGLHIEWVGP